MSNIKSNATLSVAFQGLATVATFSFYGLLAREFGLPFYGYFAILVSIGGICKLLDGSLLTALARQANVEIESEKLSSELGAYFVLIWSATSAVLIAVGSLLLIALVNHLPTPPELNSTKQSPWMISIALMIQLASINARSVWDLVKKSWIKNALACAQSTLILLIFSQIKSNRDSVAISIGSVSALFCTIPIIYKILNRESNLEHQVAINRSFRLKTLIPFGIKYQIAGILSALIEALSRLAFSWMGEFQALAIYDLANRIYLQSRTIFFTIGESSLPHLSSAKYGKEAFLFLQSIGALSAMALTISGPIAVQTCALFLATEIKPPQTIAIIIMALSSGINALSFAIYFRNIAESNQNQNILMHVLGMCTLTVTLLIGAMANQTTLLYYATSIGSMVGNVYLWLKNQPIAQGWKKQISRSVLWELLLVSTLSTAFSILINGKVAFLAGLAYIVIREWKAPSLAYRDYLIKFTQTGTTK